MPTIEVILAFDSKLPRAPARMRTLRRRARDQNRPSLCPLNKVEIRENPVAKQRISRSQLPTPRPAAANCFDDRESWLLEPTSSRRASAERLLAFVENLDRVQNLDLQVRAARAGTELEDATGISGGDHARAARTDLFHFLVEDREGILRSLDRVEARGAATIGGAGERNEDEAGNRTQQLARLRGDALPVDEMARLVVRNFLRER